MSSVDSKNDYEDVNKVEQGILNQETVGQEGNSSSDISPEGENFSTISEAVTRRKMQKACRML